MKFDWKMGSGSGTRLWKNQGAPTVKRLCESSLRNTRITQKFAHPMPGRLSQVLHIARRLHHTAMPVHKTAHPFDKARLEALLNRRFFYAPAFEIYGGPPPVAPLRSTSLTPPQQASPACTTTARPAPPSRPTSSPNGAATLSSTIICSSSTPPS